MEELSKRNGKGVWLREVEKVLKRLDASLEWFIDKMKMRDEEMDAFKENQEMETHDKVQLLGAKRMKKHRGCAPGSECSHRHAPLQCVLGNKKLAVSEKDNHTPEHDRDETLQKDMENSELLA